MLSCIAVGLGGFLGAVLRYLIGLIPLDLDSGFPIKTFIINIVGCFAIGLITAAAAKNNNMNSNLVLFLKVGICGGFTTFSSFALETADLIKAGSVGVAVLYAVLSLVIGSLAVLAAQALVR